MQNISLFNNKLSINCKSSMTSITDFQNVRRLQRHKHVGTSTPLLHCVLDDTLV